MNLKGKSFLKLLDLTPEEIVGLLELAAKLKAEKKAGVPTGCVKARTLPCCLPRIPPAPAVPLRWRAAIWAWA